MKKIIVLVIICGLIFAQSGYVKTPEQLYNSIDNKKPTGDELFGNNDLPEIVDLSDHFPKPGYQGTIGSCAAWAVGYACKSYQEGLEHGQDPNKEENHFSPSFIYNMVNKGENRGSTFPEVFNLVKEVGCATMNTMPYTTDYLLKPNSEAFEEAANFKILNYKRLQNGPGLIPAIKSALAKGQPVIVAQKVYENFRYLEKEIYDKIEGERRGGHGMCIIGYNNKNGTFKLINSWGKKWGENGYCRIAYELADKLFMEAYVCEDAVEQKEVEILIAEPKGLVASEGAFEKYIELSWNQVVGAEKYDIYRSNNKKEQFDKVKTILEAKYKDTDVLDKVKYIYSIKAIGKDRISDFSEIACGWSTKEELGIPGNLNVEKYQNGILLTWSRVNRTEKYNIYRMKDNEMNYILIAQSSDESFSDTEILKNINSDLSVYYLVTAQRGKEESPYSNMVTIKLFTPKNKELIPDKKNNIARKILPTDTHDKIIPKDQQKELEKSREQVDFYDTDYMEKFFEAARKAEQEAFRKMKEEEKKYYNDFKKYEEEMYKKFK